MYYIKEHNEYRLNPQTLACAINLKVIQSEEMLANGGLQPSKCKSQIMGILVYLIIAANATQPTTTKVTSQASNLTHEQLTLCTIATNATQPTTIKVTGTKQKTQLQKVKIETTMLQKLVVLYM